MGDVPADWPALPRAALDAWHRGGWVGVDLFFVLSGFLVSGLLFSEYRSRGKLSLGRFYMRRGWKIYPPFFALIAITWLVNPLFGLPLGIYALASEVTFLQAYFPGLWNHTWSLSVEEHFYILLPLVLTAVLALNRRSREPFRPLFAITAAVGVLVLAARVLTWRCGGPFDYRVHLFPTHLRLDSLLFGVAIACAYHFHADAFVARLEPWRRQLVAGGLLLLAPAFLFKLEDTPFVSTIGLTIFYIGSGMLLVGVLLSRLPAGRTITLLAALGAYSYSIYLWHMPVMEWGVPLLERAAGATFPFALRMPIYLVGSLLVGVAMAKVVEMPALKLRDRWFPSRSAALRESTPADDERAAGDEAYQPAAGAVAPSATAEPAR
jgi:peptidoglycan/LPS O-acetylase OafA/YrhL